MIRELRSIMLNPEPSSPPRTTYLHSYLVRPDRPIGTILPVFTIRTFPSTWWCPGHVRVLGKEEADSPAKGAATVPGSNVWTRQFRTRERAKLKSNQIAAIFPVSYQPRKHSMTPGSGHVLPINLKRALVGLQSIRSRVTRTWMGHGYCEESYQGSVHSRSLGLVYMR